MPVTERHALTYSTFMKHLFIFTLFLGGLLSSCAQTSKKSTNKKTMDTPAPGMDSLINSAGDTAKVVKTEEEWKKLLPADVYYVARQKGTERPWTSKYEAFHDTGTYYCRACGNALFLSDTKFESGCGWPSFYKPVSKNSILYAADNSHGMVRTEVMCGRCEAHLGHVFEDGPPPTGLRYCINGVILDFKEAQKAEKDYNKDKEPKKGE
jgi:peptide-methionine (R)-S-oxide reductase